MGYYYGGMMMRNPMHHDGGGLLCGLLMIVLIVDLVILGMWMWKRMKREDIKIQKALCNCTADCSCPKAEAKK
jgi:hypothetical protein